MTTVHQFILAGIHWFNNLPLNLITMRQLYILFFICLVSSPISYAQSVKKVLSTNSMKATLSNDGSFFNNPDVGSHGYSFKADTSYSLIFHNVFYFGGYDQSGAFHFTNMGKSYEGKQDINTGPVSNNYNDSTYIEEYGAGVWQISKSEIIHHVSNYYEPGYVLSENIENWPANGDQSLGVDNDLAPYVDFNNNGFYDPENGDYPCIKGDEAVYFIYNDDVPADSSDQFEKVGLEIHMMFYQYDTNDYLDSTTFLSLRLKNTGGYSYDTLNVGQYSDMDVGFAENNYIGTDSIRQLAYTYKASIYDTTVIHPAVGMLSLDHDLSFAMPLLRFSSGNYKLSPLIGSFNGRFSDSTFLHYGGTGHINNPNTSNQRTNLAYTGNPHYNQGWTELNNSQGDRRLLITHKTPAFSSLSSHELNFAFIVNRSSDTHLENVSLLKVTSDSVKSKYLSDIANEDCIVGTKNNSSTSNLTIYNNPVTDKIVYKVTNLKGEKISLFTLNGDLLDQKDIHKMIQVDEFEVSHLNSGVYIVKAGSEFKKVVVL